MKRDLVIASPANLWTLAAGSGRFAGIWFAQGMTMFGTWELLI